MVERRNVVFIETPSKMMSSPINETDDIDEMDNAGIISLHDGPEDNDTYETTHCASTSTPT